MRLVVLCFAALLSITVCLPLVSRPAKAAVSCRYTANPMLCMIVRAHTPRLGAYAPPRRRYGAPVSCRYTANPMLCMIARMHRGY